MLIASRNAGRLSAGFLSANANSASSDVGFIGVLWRLCAVASFGGLLESGKFLFPLGGLGGFAPGVVELHQPFERFRDPARGVEIGGHAGLALNEAFVALQQERFGVGVFLLTRQTRPKLAHDVGPIRL